LGSIKRESVTFWPRPYDYWDLVGKD
jgi:hypothetical protein